MGGNGQAVGLDMLGDAWNPRIHMLASLARNWGGKGRVVLAENREG